MALPFTPEESRALISDPTSSLCGNFVRTLLRLPVLFDQLIRYLFDADGNPLGLLQAGDKIESFTPLTETAHRKLCNGQTLDKTTYAVLFAAIGSTYDTMDGQSAPGGNLFRVPKCGARFALANGSLPVGGAVGNGDVGGEEQHALTVAELPAHYHTTTLKKSTYDIGPDTLFATGNGQDTGDYPDQLIDSSDTGDDDAHNNLPPYYGVYVYIVTGI